MGKYRNGVYHPTKEGLKQAKRRLEERRIKHKERIAALSPEEIEKLREEELRELAISMLRNSKSILDKVTAEN